MQPFVLHAHFYQPERLNPWTGELDPEPSAAPDRDWNERILRECYRPNGFARIFDNQRRVERIVNNYERLSFNFGPTLLDWLERADPETYARILDGDWRSAVRTGHGNAMAQAYNHMILPLANARDRRTQVLWGLADFTHRFSRPPEGLWLPETAADQATVDTLIEAGVGFTVLAPNQAARVRPIGGEWTEPPNGIDTSRPYRLLHSDGSGRWIAAFFYDGTLAQSLAFDPAAADAAVLVERIHSSTDGGGLVHAAMDGETFGHHHPFAELGLAYALFEAAEHRGMHATNYATYLANHPPSDDAALIEGEGTAWSCAHGVGRWYRDCGCSTDALPGWNQEWRGPLREALDVVRDTGIELFESLGESLMMDPWDARDDYVRVRLGEWGRTEFLDRHAKRGLDPTRQNDLWTLLEAQRHAMVMYTSCGWFFADISGIETVYVLRSAARVLDLLSEAGAGEHAAGARGRLLEVLGQAKSNKPGVGTGADVWRTEVEPHAVTPIRVAAHLSLLGLVRGEQAATPAAAAGHRVSLHDQRSETRGRVGLTTSRLTLESVATDRSFSYSVAAVQLGGLDFYGVVAPYLGDGSFEQATTTLWDAFPTASVARLIHLVGDLLDGEEFGLEQALPQGRQELVGALLAELSDRFQSDYARLYSDHRRVLEMLTAAGFELPRELRAAAELTLTARLETELLALPAAVEAGNAEPLATIKGILGHAREQGYHLDLSALEEAIGGAVTTAARKAAASLDPHDVDEVVAWLGEATELGIAVDLSRAQEHAYTVAEQARTSRLNHEQAIEAQRLAGRLALAPVAWSEHPPA